MTVRGGGVPRMAMAFMPSKRMGPPLRSFAADAHHCIMVRVLWVPPNRRMWRDPYVHHTRAPPRPRHPDTAKCAGVLEAVKGEAPSLAR